MITKLQNQSFLEEVKQRIYFNNFLNSSNGGGINVFKKEKKFSLEERTKIVVEGQSGAITIDEICAREGISPSIFYHWTQDFLRINSFESKVIFPELSELAEDEKFRIVIEGKTGVTSIAQICRREKITQNIFLDWSQEFLNVRKRNLLNLKIKNPVYQKNKELISNISNAEVFNYFENYIDLSTNRSVVILRSDSLRLDKVKDIDNVVSLQKVNDIRYINKHFEKINSKLQKDGIFIGCLETFTARKQRKSINSIPIISSIYFAFEFLFKRILPKVSFTKKYYFDITKGNDRLLSKAEGLGRLVSCGFSIMDYKTIDGLLYFVVKKVDEPTYDINPSYGPVYKMSRIGKNGKMIGVYKFRTMHPYSEYLQDYIVNANGYAKTGKPADDFRIPVWGKFMRRLWLDELPQLYNVLKGELKLVGIRPVSKRYFQDIPKEMQKLRLTQIPGCIPPYVSLNRAGNVMSVLNAEKEYLEEKLRSPFTTDTKYFFNAIFNIVINHKRSA